MRGQQQPTFSIIVPTYTRPRQLSMCLQALAELHYPRERFEVIAVNDGSVVPPEVVVASFRDEIDITLLTQLHAGPATARNTGAARAKGQFLAFTDDDCRPALDWLKSLAVRFGKDPDCVIGGRTINALPDNPYSSASQLLIDYLYSYYNADPYRARFLASNNLAMAADRFRAIGGFDATFPRAAGEDRELCDRWQHRGYRMIHAPEVVVYHSHNLTAKTFLRQHFHFGCAAYHYHFLRARRRQQPMKVEPPAFYVNMLTHPFGKIPFGKAIGVFPLVVAAQAVNAVGFFWEHARIRGGVIHSSYPAR